MRRVLLTVLLVAAPLTGCVGVVDDPASDRASTTNAWETQPPVATPSDPTSLNHLASVDAEQGFDVASKGDFAYVAARSGFYTVDVSDPANPEKLASVLDAQSRYVQLIDQDDRLIAAASGANQDVYHFVNVTDPSQPELLSSFDPGRTVHNMAVIPSSSLLYNPRGVGDPVEPGIDVIDASDPANPEVVDRWSFPPTASGEPIRTAGCGVLTFDLSRDRAYCPAVTQTYVLDITDRTEPEVLGAISNPAINVHHWTQQMDEGETVLIADWAAAGNTPTCDSREPVPPTTGPPPGALWSYDVSDTGDPQPLGYVEVPPPAEIGPDEQCSPHVVERVPGTDKVLVAWHHAGVALVDTSDPADMQVVDRWVGDTNVWSLDVHGDLVIATDRDGGIDVIALDG